jgi:glycosidase
MKKWISSSVIYQINIRSLAACEPRNAIEAVREKGAPPLSPLAFVAKNLPCIRRLGVNVLYLMPPYPIGQVSRKGIGSPYSIRDFKAIDPEFGSTEDLADLVRRAHRLNMRVILDITPNHTSRDHVWVAAHPEFYVRNPDGSLFYDLDWTDTAKLDYRNAELRREMTAVYDYWLSFLGPDENGQPCGVDGFRLDMAHFINDRSFWNEAISELRTRHSPREILFLAECYGTQNNLDLFARGINAAYDDDFYKISQYFYAVDESGRSTIAPAPEAESNADFLDKWEAFRQGGIAGAFETALRNYESVLPPGEDGPFLARYTDNHDEGRGVYRFGEQAVRAVMTLAFLSNHGLPFLLTGQEFGAENRPSIHVRLGLCDKARRVKRGDTITVAPGIEFEGNLFARGYGKRAEWLQFYRTLIALRARNRPLQIGRMLFLDIGEDCAPDQRAVVAFERRLRNRAVRCAVNMGPEPRRFRETALFQGKLLYGELENGMLPPFSGIVTLSK